MPQQQMRLPGIGTDLSGLTDEQKQVIQKDFSGKNSLTVVQAYAGSGKTHTLKSFAGAHRDGKILYLTFSKALADEAKKKFSSAKLDNVDARTIHSLAWQFFMRNKEKWNCSEVGNLSPMQLLPWAKHYFRGVHKLVLNGTAARMSCWLEKFFTSGAATFDDFFTQRELGIRDQRVGIEDKGRLGEALDAIYKNCTTGKTVRGLSGTDQLPLPHNGYLKLMEMYGASLGFDFVLVDEAQDVSSCMINIVEHQDAHRLFIGDTYQQIFGWNGAVNALEKLAARGADQLFLTKSFRCPQFAADQANAFLNILGATKPLVGRDDDSPVAHNGSSAFLCRSNAGVFDKAWDCVRKKIPFALAGGYASYNFDELLELETYMLSGRPVSAWLKDVDKNFGSFREFEAYAREYDKHAACQCALVHRKAGTMKRIAGLIREACGRSCASNLIISTAHKAKGGEWDNLELGTDFYDLNADMCAPAAPEGRVRGRRPPDTDDPKTRQAVISGKKIVKAEELRLLYVAVTRTRGTSEVPHNFLPDIGAVRRLRDGIRTGNILFI